MSRRETTTAANDKKAKGRPTMAQYLIYLSKGATFNKKEMKDCFSNAKKYLAIMKEHRIMPETAKNKLWEAFKANRHNAKYYLDQYKKIQYQIDLILSSRKIED